MIDIEKRVLQSFKTQQQQTSPQVEENSDSSN